MTSDEIIKALECCVNKKCSECPIYCNDEYLGITVMREALDLINRQQAKIEALTMENEKLQNDCELLKQAFAQKIVSEIKSEVIKEFAEKVKLKFYEEFDELIPSIMADDIDNLVTEMVGKN